MYVNDKIRYLFSFKQDPDPEFWKQDPDSLQNCLDPQHCIQKLSFSRKERKEKRKTSFFATAINNSTYNIFRSGRSSKIHFCDTECMYVLSYKSRLCFYTNLYFLQFHFISDKFTFHRLNYNSKTYEFLFQFVIQDITTFYRYTYKI